MGKLGVIIVVFICGLLAMFVESLMPGVILGLIGFVAVTGCIVYAIVSGYTTTAAAMIAVTIAFVPVFFLLWKHVAGRLFGTHGSEEGFRPSTTLSQDLLGAEGEALSPLRPSGAAHLSGRRYDVVTRGEMLEKGAHIKVIEVSGNRIVVKKV